MRLLTIGLFLLTAGLAASQTPTAVRTTDSPWGFPQMTSRADWESRAQAMRRTILFRAGLWPLPPRTPLNAQAFDRKDHTGFTVEKAYFESVPGFFVTGNLYRPRPAGTGAALGPFPAVLAPHGHSPYGRLEANDVFNEPARAANLARQGFVVFTYDMVGYNDSFQVPHSYSDPKAELWGLTVLGLQLWDSIRAIDFLESLPDVDRTRIGVSGPSGGGTQTFLVTAVDDRLTATVPANMVSHYMQGGDNCENAPGLRLDHSNVEYAAMAAPRPMLLISADGDWTRDNPRVEVPAIRSIYKLYGAEDHLSDVQFHAPHNYNRDGREASYAFFAKWLKNTPATPKESTTGVDTTANLLVWYGRERPKGVDIPGLLDYWRKLPVDPASVALAVAADPTAKAPVSRAHLPKGKPSGAVLLAGLEDAALIAELNKTGRAVYYVEPFQEMRDTKSKFFTTYNRTADQIRVQDLLNAAKTLEKQYGAIDLVGAGPGGPWALAALEASDATVVAADRPLFRRVVADVGRFPNGDEAAYLDRLNVPGILRAGGFQHLRGQGVLIHNAGGVFHAPGDVRDLPLSATAIADWLRK
jgi:dienelactone hydrolase